LGADCSIASLSGDAALKVHSHLQVLPVLCAVAHSLKIISLVFAFAYAAA
jgi:hypothetical protein